MKKALILISLVVLTSYFATEIFGQTTLEEYNYITKGFKIQIDSGLDMKKGYEIEDIDRQSTKERTAELKALYRVVDNKKEIAAYMIVYKLSPNPVEYICVPNPKSNDEINTKYWTQLYDGTNNSSQRLQLISFLLSRNMKW